MRLRSSLDWLLVLSGKEALGINGCLAAGSRCRDCLTVVGVCYVAGGENAGDIRGGGVAFCLYVACFVKVDVAFEDADVGLRLFHH